MSLDDQIKQQVKVHMKAQGRTQGEIACKWGIKQPTVAAILGRSRALSESFERLLEELDLEVVVQVKTSSTNAKRNPK